jgi:hypothetical protein
MQAGQDCHRLCFFRILAWPSDFARGCHDIAIVTADNRPDSRFPIDGLWAASTLIKRTPSGGAVQHGGCGASRPSILVDG